MIFRTLFLALLLAALTVAVLTILRLPSIGAQYRDRPAGNMRDRPERVEPRFTVQELADMADRSPLSAIKIPMFLTQPLGRAEVVAEILADTWLWQSGTLCIIQKDKKDSVVGATFWNVPLRGLRSGDRYQANLEPDAVKQELFWVPTGTRSAVRLVRSPLEFALRSLARTDRNVAVELYTDRAMELNNFQVIFGGRLVGFTQLTASEFPTPKDGWQLSFMLRESELAVAEPLGGMLVVKLADGRTASFPFEPTTNHR